MNKLTIVDDGFGEVYFLQDSLGEYLSNKSTKYWKIFYTKGHVRHNAHDFYFYSKNEARLFAQKCGYEVSN